MQIQPRSKAKTPRLFSFLLLMVFGWLVLGLTGCVTGNDPRAMVPPPNVTSTTVLPPLGVGDSITISFSGLPDPTELPPLETSVKEDGTITLQSVGAIPAAGKTPGQLENYIHDRYVPAYYNHLTVTIKTSSDLVYYVRGEVKVPGRLVYTGPITVSKAITSAGDFTDFANRSKVYLVRSNGQRFRLNCDRIIDGEAPDPPVFPGDQIEVKRRLY